MFTMDLMAVTNWYKVINNNVISFKNKSQFLFIYCNQLTKMKGK